VVVYDPNLLSSLSKKLSVLSSFNGLAHCAAALQDVTSDPVTRMVAEEGIKSIAAALRGFAEASPSGPEALATAAERAL
jgi:maleylacetate reductase